MHWGQLLLGGAKNRQVSFGNDLPLFWVSNIHNINQYYVRLHNHDKVCKKREQNVESFSAIFGSNSAGQPRAFNKNQYICKASV